MARIISVLVLAICIICLNNCTAQLCTPEEFDGCTADASDLVHQIINAYVPVVDVPSLEQHCSYFESTANCLYDFYPLCQYNDKASVDGLVDAYDWICNDGFEVYSNITQCLANFTLHSELEDCREEYLERVTALATVTEDPDDPDEFRFYMCIYINEMFDCEQNAVHSYCGDAAAIWTREFETRYFEPAFELLDCSFREEGPLGQNVSVEHCTAENFDTCLENTEDHIPSVLGSFVPVLDLTNLDQHCRDFDETATCIDNFYWHCTSANQGVLDGFVHAYTWLCHEAREEYRNYSSCLHQSELLDRGSACNETLNRYPVFTNRVICQKMNEFFGCVHAAVEDLCGEDAAQWTHEFDKRAYSDDLASINCEMDEHGHGDDDDQTGVSTTTTTTTTGNPRECSQDAYNRCTADVEHHMDSVINSIVPIIEVQYLQDHCQDIVAAGACIDAFHSDCTVFFQLQYAGLQDAYQWICDDGKNRYVRHAGCLQTRDIHREGRDCERTFQGQILTEANLSADELCEYINEYMDCAHGAVKRYCGKDAADWTRQFDVLLFQPLYDVHDCQLEGPSSNPNGHKGKNNNNNNSKADSFSGVTIGLVVFFVLFICIAIAIAIVVFYVVKIHKRRSTTAGGSRSAAYVSNTAPNAYAPDVYLNGLGAMATAPPAGARAAPLPTRDASTFTQNHTVAPNPYTNLQFGPQPPPYTPPNTGTANVNAEGFAVTNSIDPQNATAGFYELTDEYQVQPQDGVPDGAEFEAQYAQINAHQQGAEPVQASGDRGGGIVNPMYQLAPDSVQ